MPKLDRRVRRTRRRLRDALIELILEQGYDAITIQAIADRADLSRATFYLHYRDKDELLANSLEEMFDDLAAALEVSIKQLAESIERNGDGSEFAIQPTVIAFRHVAEYSDLYKALLLGDRSVTYVMHREIQYLARITERQLEIMRPSQDTAPSIPLEITAHHLAGSLFALILWWLENDMPHTPEHMATLFEQLTLQSTLASLGFKTDVLDFASSTGS